RDPNPGRTLTPISIQAKPVPDLAVTQVTGPASGQSGQSVRVHWTEANSGTADAAGPWNDKVYLSPDGTLANATLLATTPHRGGLAAGAGEDDAADVVLPGLPDGAYHLVVVANADHAVFDA